MKQSRASQLPRLRDLVTPLSLFGPSNAQSFVGGDLSNQAPYGIPAQNFAAAISTPTSNATFAIPGYNTSIPAGAIDGTGTSVDGWSITIGVTGNVPLTGATFNGIDTTQCIDATTLSISPPADIASCNKNDWRVCAIVFTDGLDGTASGTGTLDSSCSAHLPDDCIDQLQVNSVAGKAGRNGTCEDLDIPEACKGYFAGNGGTAYGELLGPH
ncbi:hypothetical protein VTK56DRAFT_5969 [Thermocarpiscus australiensis]